MRLLKSVMALIVVLSGCGQVIGLGDVEEIPHDGGSAGSAGSAGSDGGAGAPTCWTGQKICGDECVGFDDPSSGCGSTGCDPCIVPGATATCQGKLCAVESCLPGWEDCDQDQLAPGCEVNIANDPKHCGGCSGEDCTLKGPTWICKDFVCQISGCDPPTNGNCDNDSTNGCEIDLLTDVNNCGFCGNLCNAANAANACVNGECTYSCNLGYADCDGQALNGCEINLNNDKGHCGSCVSLCGDPANGVGFCNGGQCDFVCSTPYTNCGGVCSDLKSDVNNCGSCGNKCVNTGGGQAFCSNSTCTISCTAPLVNCNGTCIDTQTNKNNCGSCGNVCVTPAGGVSVCSGGVCQKVCPSGQTVCGSGAGVCVNTQTSNSNCGNCGNACVNERICMSGSCQCPSGAPKACATSCEPECCGSSDCNGGKTCIGGVCQ